VTGVNLANPTPGGCSAIVAGAAANNIRSIDPHWQTPYMQHWSLDVQRQLTSKTVVTVGYYGSKGTNLIGGFEKNLVRPGDAISRGATGCAPPVRRISADRASRSDRVRSREPRS
jgi:hypothetical protein